MSKSDLVKTFDSSNNSLKKTIIFSEIIINLFIILYVINKEILNKEKV